MENNKFVVGILIFIIAIFNVPIVPIAQGIDSEEAIVIDEYEKYRGDLITFKDIINNRGIVVGDIMMICQLLNNNGLVKGDILGISKRLDLNGTVNGDIRVWTKELNITGEVYKNMTLITRNLILNKEGVVDGSLTVFGDKVVVNGMIGSDVRGYINTLIINGKIKGDIDVTVREIKLGPTAKVFGDINYSSEKKIDLKKALIMGKISYSKRRLPINIKQIEEIINICILAIRMSLKIGLYMVGVLFIVLWPKKFEQLKEYRCKEAWEGLYIGFCALLLIPLIIIALLISLLGTPLALMLLGPYIITIYLARIPVAIWVTYIILKDRLNNVWRLILGLILIDAAALIPHLGVVINVGVVILGFGLYLRLAGDFRVSLRVE